MAEIDLKLRVAVKCRWNSTTNGYFQCLYLTEIKAAGNGESMICIDSHPHIKPLTWDHQSEDSKLRWKVSMPTKRNAVRWEMKNQSFP